MESELQTSREENLARTTLVFIVPDYLAFESSIPTCREINLLTTQERMNKREREDKIEVRGRIELKVH